MTATSRRIFFRYATLGGIGLAVPVSGTSPAMEPVRRGHGAGMKLSLAGYSFRKEFKSDPPEMTLLVVLVTIGIVGLLYVVLPGLFVLFYRSPHVAATCRARHPQPQWIDRCPRKLLTLMVVWLLAAVSVLMMPAYNFIFPLFGIVLTGTAGAVLWALVLATSVALAVGTCRRAPWAWWSGVALTLTAAVSSILTVLRYDLAEIMAVMELPEDQVSMIAMVGMPDGWLMALINALVWGSFLAYLMSLRRFFVTAPVIADD